LKACFWHCQLPTVSAPAKEEEDDKLEVWQNKVDKAADIMWLIVEFTSEESRMMQ
jgi:hypothetical protein